MNDRIKNAAMDLANEINVTLIERFEELAQDATDDSTLEEKIQELVESQIDDRFSEQESQIEDHESRLDELAEESMNSESVAEVIAEVLTETEISAHQIDGLAAEVVDAVDSEVIELKHAIAEHEKAQKNLRLEINELVGDVIALNAAINELKARSMTARFAAARETITQTLNSVAAKVAAVFTKNTEVK